MAIAPVLCALIQQSGDPADPGEGASAAHAGGWTTERVCALPAAR
jgi:hypothetical protein